MNTRGLLMATVLLLAAAAVSWFAVFAPRTPKPEGRTVRNGGAAVTTANDGVHTNDRTPTANATRTEADAAPDAQLVRVHVLDARGDPVPGATVRYWPPRDDERRKQDDAWLEEHDDFEAALARSGATATTAVDGTVVLDARLIDPDDTSVTARLGDLYGVGNVHSNAHDVLIQVQRDIELTVEVVDSLGRGQRGLCVRFDLEQLSLHNGMRREETCAKPTDDAGRILVRHLQLALESATDATDQRLRIWCQRRASDASVVTIAERRVSWDELSAKTKLQLVVPAGGSIAVRVLDAGGKPADAQVWLSDEAGETWQSDPETVGDVWWFGSLPPQRRWTITARVDAELPDATMTVKGPASVDDVVEVDIRVPSLRRWSFLAKLIRSDGLPVGNPNVRWVCPELAVDVTLDRYTDDEGRLTNPLSGHFAETLRVAHQIEMHVEAPSVTAQVFRFDRTFGPGDNDLGTLVLAPPAGERVLASVDVRGEGASLNATVGVHLWTASTDLGVLLRRKDDRIELLGTPPGEPMFLICGCDGWLAFRSPISLGEHCIVDLERAAELRVPFVAPALPLDQLTAELCSLDREARFDAELDSRARTFRWSSMPPGRYRMSILGAGRTLHEEPELHLHGGWQYWPTATARLDLRGSVRACRVVARTSDPDRRLLGTETLCVPPGSDPPSGFDEKRLSEHWFLPTAEPFDLLVRAFPFVPQRLRDPRRDVALDMQPLTKVSVHAANDPEAKIHVRIREDGVRDPGLRAFDTCNDHDADREHEGEAALWSAPGTVLEAWVVRTNEPPSPETIVVGTTSPQTVTLR